MPAVNLPERTVIMKKLYATKQKYGDVTASGTNNPESGVMYCEAGAGVSLLSRSSPIPTRTRNVPVSMAVEPRTRLTAIERQVHSVHLRHYS